MMSKGAEAKYDQKQMLAKRKNQEILRSKVRHVTSAIKDGREANSTSIESRIPMNTAKHAALQGCVRLYQPTVPVQPTARARREFSEFFTVFRFRKFLPWTFVSCAV